MIRVIVVHNCILPVVIALKRYFQWIQLLSQLRLLITLCHHYVIRGRLLSKKARIHLLKSLQAWLIQLLGTCVHDNVCRFVISICCQLNSERLRINQALLLGVPRLFFKGLSGCDIVIQDIETLVWSLRLSRFFHCVVLHERLLIQIGVEVL